MSKSFLKIANGKRINLSTPKIMGIINATPDSFSGDGILEPEKALEQAYKMVSDGADIIDIGGQSTRPNHKRINSSEESKRVIPVLKKITSNVDIPISVDTFYPDVAKEALFFGASIINDVSGFVSLPMCRVINEFNCGWVLMSAKNIGGFEPVFEVYNDLETLSNEAIKNGVDADSICLDPGFGFGKAQPQDISLLKEINELSELNFPLLMGISRKRMVRHLVKSSDIKKLDKKTAQLSVEATKSGVGIIRVHNVKEAKKELKKLYG